jgi:hypothetical protein
LNSGTIYYVEGRMTYALPTDSSTFLSVAGQHYTTRMMVWGYNGPYTAYYSFNHNDCIHSVLEVLPNVFAHLSYGVIDKFGSGSWTGGEYITASGCAEYSWIYGYYYDSRYNSYPFDGGYGERYGSYPGSYPGYVRRSIGGSDYTDFAIVGRAIVDNQRCRMMTRGGIFQNLVENFSPNEFNMRSAIFPCYVRFYDSSDTRDYFGGEIPGVGYLNNKEISSKAIVDTNWQVFPIVAKNTTDKFSYPSSGDEALAYLRA